MVFEWGVGLVWMIELVVGGVDGYGVVDLLYGDVVGGEVIDYCGLLGWDYVCCWWCY